MRKGGGGFELAAAPLATLRIFRIAFAFAILGGGGAFLIVVLAEAPFTNRDSWGFSERALEKSPELAEHTSGGAFGGGERHSNLHPPRISGTGDESTRYGVKQGESRKIVVGFLTTMARFWTVRRGAPLAGICPSGHAPQRNPDGNVKWCRLDGECR